MDGHVGPITLSALSEAEKDIPALISSLRAAREWYERKIVHRDETSKFWKGLVNRWDKVESACLS
jgi:hypothetical protein